MSQTVIAPKESDPSTSETIATVPNSPEPAATARASVHETLQEAETSTGHTDIGLIGELHPLNQLAKNAFRLLADRRRVEFYHHHCKYIHEDLDSQCFVFSLNHLPEFAPLGWRIGRGRKNLPNLGVDILVLLEEGKSNDDIAGIHARFAWVKGGGGFFLVADNMRGKSVTLNGEALCHEQRLIPFRNAVSIGEYYFTVKFPKRTTEQDEQFQLELAMFYTHVLTDSVPLVVPTPNENETKMGDWVVRDAIAKGGFGHVYAVTHSRTGNSAAAKELWRTERTSRKVDQEITMAKYLLAFKHVCKQLIYYCQD